MQLSILMPTHRDDLLSLSRITQACSWASLQVQVVVSDNSGSKSKQEFLDLLRRKNIPNCEIIADGPNEPVENFANCLSAAKGDFVFFVADDDCSFDRAQQLLPTLTTMLMAEPTAAGITGLYIIEKKNGSSIATYLPLDADDVSSRIANYLQFEGPNLLFYSPIKRRTAQSCFDFISAAPLQFSFRDQIMSLIYLLSGKYVNIQRLLYLYDYGRWEWDWKNKKNPEELDIEFYRAAGMDPALNRLHWLLCGFEGAKVISNSRFSPDASPEDRNMAFGKWLETMFRRFESEDRDTGGSAYLAEADAVARRWLGAYPNITPDKMLADIYELISLFSKSNAEKYREFWQAV